MTPRQNWFAKFLVVSTQVLAFLTFSIALTTSNWITITEPAPFDFTNPEYGAEMVISDEDYNLTTMVAYDSIMPPAPSNGSTMVIISDAGLWTLCFHAAYVMKNGTIEESIGGK